MELLAFEKMDKDCRTNANISFKSKSQTSCITLFFILSCPPIIIFVVDYKLRCVLVYPTSSPHPFLSLLLSLRCLLRGVFFFLHNVNFKPNLSFELNKRFGGISITVNATSVYVLQRACRIRCQLRIKPNGDQDLRLGKTFLRPG